MTALLLAAVFVLVLLSSALVPRAGILLLTAVALYLTYLAIQDGQIVAAAIMAANATLLGHTGLFEPRPTTCAKAKQVSR